MNLDFLTVNSGSVRVDCDHCGKRTEAEFGCIEGTPDEIREIIFDAANDDLAKQRWDNSIHGTFCQDCEEHAKAALDAFHADDEPVEHELDLYVGPCHMREVVEDRESD